MHLVGYPRELSIETNLKQIQGRRPCIQKEKIFTTYKDKTTHIIFTYKSMAGKKVIYSKKIIMYCPQKDKTLSTSKKESKKWWNKQLA